MTAPYFGLVGDLKMNYFRNCRAYAVTKRTDAIITHDKQYKLKLRTGDRETSSEILVFGRTAVSYSPPLPKNSVASASPLGDLHTETLPQKTQKKHLTVF
jgi:hypothetical protein